MPLTPMKRIIDKANCQTNGQDEHTTIGRKLVSEDDTYSAPEDELEVNALLALELPIAQSNRNRDAIERTLSFPDSVSLADTVEDEIVGPIETVDVLDGDGKASV